MNTTKILCWVLSALLFTACLFIPVSAYSSDATKLYTAGHDLTESGNYTGAVAAYNSVITLEPLYYEAWDGIADALNRQGQFNDALAASNRSLEIFPGYVRGWINRGQILYNIGYRYEDVGHDSTTANTLYTEQLMAFDKALSLDPDNAEAWFNKGYALAGMRRYDEAIAAFDQVRVIEPSYPNLQKNREIAVQLRDMTGGSPVTTGPAGQATALKTTSPESSAQQPVTTSARPVPLSSIAGVIAVCCAGILILKRK